MVHQEDLINLTAKQFSGVNVLLTNFSTEMELCWRLLSWASAKSELYRVSQNKLSFRNFQIWLFIYISRPFCLILGSLDQSGPPRLFWAILSPQGHSGPFWSILGHSGPYGPFWAPWAILGPMDHSGPSEPFWANLGNFGPTGPFWALWAVFQASKF